MIGLTPTPNYPLAAQLGIDIAAMIQHFQCCVAESIDNLDGCDAETEIRKAVVTHGGTLIEPTSQWGPLEVQLSLIGVSASGATIAEAGRQWVKAVSRMTTAAA
ncbi:hypothetical protein DS901_13395 [Loktanella sp. D2R18]|uniref:hypothetical protein n=1 Tax=Rhodobacterales TaxID=204455 RepID=UPI000DEBBF68|nr:MULTISPECIES: hypothetical protein [Rhodobacterales]MDO6591733.1 hypothetical protein [Yoonia sp. 1_MG-2023]RBW42553.1 hypothetical protein DS901_13395 [Loktanella sp. D2R18]